MKDHAAFHKEVASLINRKNKGEALTVEAALGNQSKFRELSQKVVNAIMKLKRNLNH
jgi:hypothetical protein